MRVLLCPASLKGVLSARAAAAALAPRCSRGRRRRGRASCCRRRRRDGRGARGGARRRVASTRSSPIRWGGPCRRAGCSFRTAARSSRQRPRSGCRCSPPRSAIRLRASSRGFGELVLAALERSPASLVVALGGVATVDGGAGLREVVRRACRYRPSLSATCGRGSPTRRGSSGRRKARRRTDVADARAAARGDGGARPYAELPGSGAAGGLGAALAALGAELVPGAPTVLDLLGFDERSRGAATSSSRGRAGRRDNGGGQGAGRGRCALCARRACAASSSAVVSWSRSKARRRSRSPASGLGQTRISSSSVDGTR